MKMKILLVEDHLASRDVLERLLLLEGYAVWLAADGQEALQELSRNPPDLIISDLMMPVLDGIQLLLQLRKMPQFAALPVLILTGGGSLLQRQALRAGADAVLRKPLQFDVLLRTLEELLSQQRHKAADLGV